MLKMHDLRTDFKKKSQTDVKLYTETQTRKSNQTSHLWYIKRLFDAL